MCDECVWPRWRTWILRKFTRNAPSDTINVTPAPMTWKQIGALESSGKPVSADDILGKWEWGGERELGEHSAGLFPEGVELPYDPESVSERRLFFGDEEARQGALTAGAVGRDSADLLTRLSLWQRLRFTRITFITLKSLDLSSRLIPLRPCWG